MRLLLNESALQANSRNVARRWMSVSRWKCTPAANWRLIQLFTALAYPRASNSACFHCASNCWMVGDFSVADAAAAATVVSIPINRRARFFLCILRNNHNNVHEGSLGDKATHFYGAIAYGN